MKNSNKIHTDTASKLKNVGKSYVTTHSLSEKEPKTKVLSTGNLSYIAQERTEKMKKFRDEFDAGNFLDQLFKENGSLLNDGNKAYGSYLAEQEGETLRSIRYKSNLTQSQIATLVGINQSQFSRIEKNPYSVNIQLISRILQALGTTPEQAGRFVLSLASNR